MWFHTKIRTRSNKDIFSIFSDFWMFKVCSQIFDAIYGSVPNFNKKLFIYLNFQVNIWLSGKFIKFNADISYTYLPNLKYAKITLQFFFSFFFFLVEGVCFISFFRFIKAVLNFIVIQSVTCCIHENFNFKRSSKIFPGCTLSLCNVSISNLR